MLLSKSWYFTTNNITLPWLYYYITQLFTVVMIMAQRIMWFIHCLQPMT